VRLLEYMLTLCAIATQNGRIDSAVSFNSVAVAAPLDAVLTVQGDSGGDSFVWTTSWRFR
jgi:hypothetical protein